MPALSPLRAFAEPAAPEESPVLFDLESIEASALDPIEFAPLATPSVPDPFFGAAEESFSSTEASENESGAELTFEEGLAAAEWPDTSEFAHRITLPRGMTPVSVTVTPDAVDAFGREPDDAVIPAPLEPEPDLTDVAERAAAPMVESTVASVETELFWISPPGAPHEDDDDQEPAHSEAIGGFAPSDDEEPVAVFDDAESEPLGVAEADTDDAELPWLAAPVTPDAEVGAIVEAFAEDARAKGESDDVSVVAMPEPAAPEPVAAAEESSFANVMGSDNTDERNIAAYGADRTDSEEEAPVATGAGAFVTETMGELFVAQGLTDRAISVYEELVRRRPHDPAPAARLAELRAQMAERDADPAASIITARARFAALAARRVDRRTPAVGSLTAAPPAAVSAFPSSDSLASMFDGVPAPADEQAALGFASAFGTSHPISASDSFFGSAAMAVGLAVTPVSGTAPEAAPFGASTATLQSGTASTPRSTSAGEESYAFDRFFPDPAAAPSTSTLTPAVAPASEPRSSSTTPAGDSKAADDLAQFSAWLKGLGAP